MRLNDIEGQEYCIEATVRSQTQKTIQAKTDSSGAIRNTPLQKTLKFKVKARVMLTFNIDVCDSLTNGTFGEVVGVELGKFGEVNKVIVNFDDEDCGRDRRKRNTYLQKKFGSRATPIEKIEFQYSLSKKATSVSATATALQFPLRLAFAATAHKIQGATVKKPSALVIDLRSVKEAAQAHVMLSRIQALSQLYIIESVPEHKIYSSPQALDELRRLSNIAMNNKQLNRGIVSCNIRSLAKHYGDIKRYPNIEHSDILCLQETWLDPAKVYCFDIKGMQVEINSQGRGKGIATFYNEKFNHKESVTHAQYQMTMISSIDLDIINIYRSLGAPSNQLMTDIRRLLNLAKSTIIVGDLNICAVKEKFHTIIRYLTRLGFQQKVSFPTHDGGGHLDHVYIYEPPESDRRQQYKVLQQSVYFTDHDILFICMVSLNISIDIVIAKLSLNSSFS